MKKKWLAIGIILLFVGTFFIPFISFCSAESDEYYFEDVYVIITGRCSTIFTSGEWWGGLFIGNQSHPAIYAKDLPWERLNINVYEQFTSKPCFSLKQSKDIGVDIIDTNGIFFWGCKTQYSARLLPPVIFVICHAEEVYVRLK